MSKILLDASLAFFFPFSSFLPKLNYHQVSLNHLIPNHQLLIAPFRYAIDFVLSNQIFQVRLTLSGASFYQKLNVEQYQSH